MIIGHNPVFSLLFSGNLFFGSKPSDFLTVPALMLFILGKVQCFTPQTPHDVELFSSHVFLVMEHTDAHSQG